MIEVRLEDDRRAEADHPLRSTVVGVLVHNEDPTVETCLRAILAERDGEVSVRSVLVVASGCTDRTVEIVRSVAEEDPRVRLIVEAERTGKAAAINLLLRESSDPIVVVIGGDVVFTPGSLTRLLEPFRDPGVGMTGVRPIPTNARSGLVGNAVNIVWDLHHELSLHRPKLGEAVAFRRVLQSIDRGTLVDEAVMEGVIVASGLQLRYIPGAVVRNHGPETVREFMAQRTRIYEGHLALAASTGYRVSSMDVGTTARVAWRLWRRGTSLRYLLAAAVLEAVARSRARLSHARGRRPHNGVWHPLATSKRVIANGHVLRSHHDRVETLDLGQVNSRHARSMLARVRQLLRAEDRIKIDRGRLIVKFRGDAAGAHAVRTRLASELPAFEETTSEAPKSGGV